MWEIGTSSLLVNNLYNVYIKSSQMAARPISISDLASYYY